jgi:hypothetical protein
MLRVRRSRLPLRRWWAALRGRAWRSPELRVARLLFHLERHGIPAPKMFAYGQTVPRMAPAGSFLLSEVVSAGPVGPGAELAVGKLLDRLHAAGCRLIDLGPAGEPFGVVDGRVVVSDITRLRLTKGPTRRQTAGDRARVAAYFRGLR